MEAGVAIELMEDRLSPKNRICCFDELKVAENIRQGGVCCGCVEYYVRVGLCLDSEFY
jgi:hypothetical protein